MCFREQVAALAALHICSCQAVQTYFMDSTNLFDNPWFYFVSLQVVCFDAAKLDSIPPHFEKFPVESRSLRRAFLEHADCFCATGILTWRLCNLIKSGEMQSALLVRVLALTPIVARQMHQQDNPHTALSVQENLALNSRIAVGTSPVGTAERISRKYQISLGQIHSKLLSRIGSGTTPPHARVIARLEQ